MYLRSVLLARKRWFVSPCILTADELYYQLRLAAVLPVDSFSGKILGTNETFQQATGESESLSALVLAPVYMGLKSKPKLPKLTVKFQLFDWPCDGKLVCLSSPNLQAAGLETPMHCMHCLLQASIMTQLAELPLSFSTGQVSTPFKALDASPSFNFFSLQAVTVTLPTPSAAVLSDCLQLTKGSGLFALQSAAQQPCILFLPTYQQLSQKLSDLAGAAWSWYLCLSFHPSTPAFSYTLLYPVLGICGLSIDVTCFWRAQAC